MTKKEIDKFLANTKVYVNGKSKEIQEKLFSLGYSWSDNTKSVLYIDKPFLYLNKDNKISVGQSMTYFTTIRFREITAEEIISLEITEPAYRPFKTQEECWNEMLKHKPFGWIKHKETQTYEDCSQVYNLGIFGNSFNDAYKYYTFADGTPFGIKVEYSKE